LKNLKPSLEADLDEDEDFPVIASSTGDIEGSRKLSSSFKGNTKKEKVKKRKASKVPRKINFLNKGMS
jgi:hypothetical protein